MAKSEITSAIIINHLQLDKYNLDKKINNPPKARKKTVKVAESGKGEAEADFNEVSP